MYGQEKILAATIWFFQSMYWTWNDHDGWNAIKRDGGNSWQCYYGYCFSLPARAMDHGTWIRLRNKGGQCGSST